MKIFYADDDQEEIGFFCEALKAIDSSIECVTASDGKHALEVLEKITTPDFIFLDLVMPRLSGKECLLHIKSNPRLSHIPVTIYSGTVTKNDAAALTKQGAYKVLNKRCTIVELCRDLKSIFVNAYAK